MLLSLAKLGEASMVVYLRRLVIFALAVLATEVLAALASTQFVLAGLTDLGVTVTLGQRLTMSLQDVVGMMGIYLPVLAFALALGFGFTALVLRRLDATWAAWGYPAAGFVAVLAALFTVFSMFDITPIAGARSGAGLLAQGLAGALGGVLFYRGLKTER